MATLGPNVAIAEFSWKMQKKLVFHFEGGRHAALPQKPVVKLLINDLKLLFSVNETLDLIRYNRSETLPNEDNFWTPLHYASKYDQRKVYELLLKHIENKNPQDLNGRTPLHIAAQSGNIDVSRSMVA